MAKIKFGAMMVDARGKLGGHVFAKNRGGNYIRTKVTPVNPSSSAQTAIRALFAAITAGWSTLTTAQRAAWNGAVGDWATTDIFGDLKNPSGKTLYQRLNQNAQNVGYSALTSPPAKATLPEDVVTAVDIAVGAGTLTLTGASASASATILLSGTPSLSQGTTFVKDRLRNIGSQVASTYAAATAYTDYVAKFGAPTAGDNVHIAIQYVLATGQVSPMQIVKATVVA